MKDQILFLEYQPTLDWESIRRMGGEMELSYVKEVPASQLPDSIRADYLYLMDNPEGLILVVMKPGGSGQDWASYGGTPKYEDLKPSYQEAVDQHQFFLSTSSGRVTKHGDKLPEEAAREIFPEVPEDYLYRS